jgi:thiol-disulfide isomerase/thioredoxin
MTYVHKILTLLIVTMSVFLPFSVSLVSAQENMQNEINWVYDYPTGMKKAQAENKPVMIFIYEEWCPRCRYMDQTTFMNHDVIQLSSNFVNIKVIGTQQGTLYNYTVPPLVVFTDPYGNPLITRNTELSAGDVLGLQRNVLASAPFSSPSGTIHTSVIASNSPLNSASATAEKKGLAIPGFDAILTISAVVSVALLVSKNIRKIR